MSRQKCSPAPEARTHTRTSKRRSKGGGCAGGCGRPLLSPELQHPSSVLVRSARVGYCLQILARMNILQISLMGYCVRTSVPPYLTHPGTQVPASQPASQLSRLSPPTASPSSMHPARRATAQETGSQSPGQQLPLLFLLPCAAHAVACPVRLALSCPLHSTGPDWG